MKQIFTQSACLFWALLLTAVFSSGSAVGQFSEIQNFNNTTKGDVSGTGFQLITLPDASSNPPTYGNTKFFEIATDGSETINNVSTGNAAWIEATPGVGNNGTNNRQYNGLIKITNGFVFRKGYTYRATLKAKSGTGTGGNKSSSSGQITLVTSTDPSFTTMTGTVPHGADVGVTTTTYTTKNFQFSGNVLQNPSQVLYVGFRLHTSTDNKSWMYVDDIEIIEERCVSSDVIKPTVNITSAPACGPGQVTLTASGAATGESYRWYNSYEDFVSKIHATSTTGNIYTTAVTQTNTFYVTKSTVAGCESEPTLVTVTINQIPSVPTIPTLASNSRCGAGVVTLQVDGAPTGGYYRWYNSSGTLISGQNGATYTTPSLTTSTNFYATVVNAAGCESTRTTVVATIITPTQVTGEIVADPAVPVINEEVTFTVKSNIIDNGHASINSIRWYSVRYEGELKIKTVVQTGGLTYSFTPTTKDPIEIESEITPSSSSCYNVSTVTFTTQQMLPLPVEIIYFTAAKQGSNVLLEWATASEENNTGFEVQVSQDGFSFRKLDFVPTKNGNTVIKQLYTFKDTENGKYGTRYYRLKQIDMDGQFEYFTTKAVSFGEVSNYSLKAFPNPFEGEVNLELNADESGKLNVQVLDAMGRSVMTQQFEVSKGRSLEKITLWQSLPKGIYFVRTEMNGQANNFKLLKK